MKILSYYFLTLTLLLLILSCKSKIQPKQTFDYNPIKVMVDDSAMVASARIEASKIAKTIMLDGGNAVDAAIATQFALAVAYPVAGNLGGGGFMIYRACDGTTDALDFREAAPLKSTKDMYLDKQGNAVSDLSQLGHLAVGVPGTVDGMITAYNKYSQLKDWKKLVQPAINLAQNGITVTNIQAKLLNKYQDKFIKVNTRPNSFIKNDQWKAGDVLIQNDLAYTLELIRDNGRDGFYKGETANKFIAEMKRSNGIIQVKDLDQYQSKWRKPIIGKYRGYKIISMPPPSSGGIALVQLLKMIEPYPMSVYGWNSLEATHLMIEAERRVYADRSKHLGDSDFYPVPIDTLISSDYIRKRMIDFNPNISTSSDSIEPGNINFYKDESTETTHFSIIDPNGNAVSITTTLNGHYGSKVVVGDAGFFLNNEMDDFSAKPGTPNMFGLLGAEANKIEPRKRMLSSMTPTIVEKGGELFLNLGTPGGATIITSVFQTIVNVIDHNMTAKEAITAKRFHHQWKPNEIKYENGAFTEQTILDLEYMEHKMKVVSSIGRVEAIKCFNGLIEGAADPRADDDVRGY